MLVPGIFRDGEGEYRQFESSNIEHREGWEERAALCSLSLSLSLSLYIYIYIYLCARARARARVCVCVCVI